MTNEQQDAAPEKKGLSPIAWIGIGCGGLFLIVAIVFTVLITFGIRKGQEFAAEFEENPSKAAAELVISLNPELELVETDDEAGTITFRNTKTGEEATLNFEDIAEGQFSVTTDEGEFTMDASEAAEGGGVTMTGPEGEAHFGASASLENVPDWVPLYPNATGAQGTFSAETNEGLTGIVSSTTEDEPQKILDYYKEKLEEDDYEIKGQTTATTPEGMYATIMGELAEKGRTLNVTVTQEKAESQIVINYNEKKE
ncbi:MAG: hypothetical protein ACE5G0_14490 [Rhodothermales bacterium]